VVSIDFRDRCRDLFIGIVEPCLATFPLLRRGLAEEIVADDRPISHVVARDSPPDLDSARETSRVVVKKRISVIDILGIVAARGVHVEQHEKTSVPAPLDNPVEKLEADPDPSAGIFLGREEPIVERHPDDVHPDGADVTNIVARDEGVIPASPEIIIGLGPDELFEGLLDLPGSRGFGEPEHIPLGYEPTAEIYAFEPQNLTIGGDQFTVSYGHESIAMVSKRADRPTTGETPSPIASRAIGNRVSGDIQLHLWASGR
jgi:hypothetical protein